MGFWIDRQMDPLQGEIYREVIDRPPMMTMGIFITRPFVVIIVFGFFCEMSMDEGCRVTMVVLIMGVKHRRREQRREHRGHAETTDKPSHASQDCGLPSDNMSTMAPHF